MGKRKDSKLDRTEPQVNSNNCGAMEQTAELGDLVREGDGDARTNGGTKDDAVDEDEAAEQAFASLDALPEVPEGEGAGPEDDGMGDIDGTAAAADAIRPFRQGPTRPRIRPSPAVRPPGKEISITRRTGEETFSSPRRQAAARAVGSAALPMLAAKRFAVPEGNTQVSTLRFLKW